MSHRPVAQGLCFGLCLIFAAIAAADDVSARSCASIVDKIARLACYDSAFGGNTVALPHSAPSDAAPVAPNAAAAAPPPGPAKTPEAAFGDTGNLLGSEKVRMPKQLTANVIDAVPLGRGLYQLTLDNGQIWQTTQSDSAVDFDSRDSITISRMLLGNYLISRAGQARTVSVKRLR